MGSTPEFLCFLRYLLLDCFPAPESKSHWREAGLARLKQRETLGPANHVTRRKKDAGNESAGTSRSSKCAGRSTGGPDSFTSAVGRIGKKRSVQVKDQIPGDNVPVQRLYLQESLPNCRWQFAMSSQQVHHFSIGPNRRPNIRFFLSR
jgi:hypothetical protein